jgi:hypothetical protein
MLFYSNQVGVVDIDLDQPASWTTPAVEVIRG